MALENEQSYKHSLPAALLSALIRIVFMPVWLVLGWASTAAAQNAPPLRIFSTISADATGKTLQTSLIWADPQRTNSGVAVVFRKTFEIAQVPRLASLSIFADARYVLWINGVYVDRGPSRFQPNGPQYDVVNAASHLRAGRNAVVILVVGNLSGGKIMRHLPGLTVLLEADGHEVLRTDTSWKWSDKTRFRSIPPRGPI
jgi:alpha-L-rhamnosidase